MVNQLNARRRQRRYQGCPALQTDVAMWERNYIQEKRWLDAERNCQRRIRLETLNVHHGATRFPDVADEFIDNVEVLYIASKLESFLDKEMHVCHGDLT